MIRSTTSGLLRRKWTRKYTEIQSYVFYTNIPIELVPERIHTHLFGDQNLAAISNKSHEEGPTSTKSEMNKALEKLQLPRLSAKGDIMAHFEQIAAEQFQESKRILKSGLGKNLVLPKRPTKWALQPGWTAYDPKTGKQNEVKFPDEELLFFDTEVCVTEGQLPTLAVAVSPTKWYSWCSNRLLDLEQYPEHPRPSHLIPLESPNEAERRPKVIVGHNVAYDRSKVREQYLQTKTPARFWDTMSMNIAISGMADHQRPMYEKADDDLQKDYAYKDVLGWIDAWKMRVSKNSLEAVHNKLCGASSMTVDKTLKEMFVKNDMETIRNNFQALTDYCANDVQATFEIYQKLFPEFEKRFPSSITYCGMLEMANAYLPISSNWRAFAKKCDNERSEKSESVVRTFVSAAKDVCEKLQVNNAYQKDPWMWVSDWSVKPSGAYKGATNWYLEMFKDKKHSNEPIQELKEGCVKMSARDIPRIFGLCYGPYPLYFKQKNGWGYLVQMKDMKPNDRMDSVELSSGKKVMCPSTEIMSLIAHNLDTKNAVPDINKPVGMNVSIFQFHQLPHSSGKPQSVGTPFAKHFADYFKQGLLWSARAKDFPVFEELLEAMLLSKNETRFWVNYSARFHEQLAIWDEKNELGAIAPSIAPAGTVTRRAVHKLWLVSANAKENMIGSDLKTMYGAGKLHAIEFLKQQGTKDSLAADIASKLFSATKGSVKDYLELKPEFKKEFEDFLENKCPAMYKGNNYMLLDGRYFLEPGDFTIFVEGALKSQGKGLFQPEKIQLYKDGFESYTFNFLEFKCRESKPETPILGCRLTKETAKQKFSKRYKRTVINWFVQSSAVDFLHMLLVCMKWLCEEYDIDARLALSIHDEVRYFVKSEDKYRCALALALSNMYVRAAISAKLGIHELPMSIAFFSQVDIDHVLRKEVTTKCKTPDGRERPEGEALDILQILQKTGGILSKQPTDQNETAAKPKQANDSRITNGPAAKNERIECRRKVGLALDSICFREHCAVDESQLFGKVPGIEIPELNDADNQRIQQQLQPEQGEWVSLSMLRLNEPGKKTKKSILWHCIYANRKPFSTKWDEDLSPDNPNHPSNELYHQMAENDARLKEYYENEYFDAQSTSASESVSSGDALCNGIAKAYTDLYQKRKKGNIKAITQK
ncbi:DNA polymerase family A domain-containing protein [Ditylenchus destructor]|uniref:Mitochondrial DNA polymerase catalytic subunit n=1 Tax=Ditylenchus destructor TaxID=166010 RepID=A0AAD4MV29_9BILA|nr:DNA polymerase family A domain-containing protein [Ditylenchus destructor]